MPCFACHCGLCFKAKLLRTNWTLVTIMIKVNKFIECCSTTTNNNRCWNLLLQFVQAACAAKNDEFLRSKNGRPFTRVRWQTWAHGGNILLPASCRWVVASRPVSPDARSLHRSKQLTLFSGPVFCCCCECLLSFNISNKKKLEKQQNMQSASCSTVARGHKCIWLRWSIGAAVTDTVRSPAVCVYFVFTVKSFQGSPIKGASFPPCLIDAAIEFGWQFWITK